MCRTTRCILAVVVALGILAEPLSATQYYFSDAGNDQTGSGTAANPWRTINKFNTLDLSPGDNVFFHAGDTFHGSLLLDQADSGTNANGELISPITISSYGGGVTARATIRSSPSSAAFLAHNSGGIELRNMEFVNGGTYASNSDSGIRFNVDLSASAELTHLQHVRIDNVISRGFHRSGLAFNSGNSVGYQDVEVTNSQFFDNQFAGLEIGSSAWTELVHQNIRIDHVIARDNPGFVGCTPHCGHGIVLGQVDDAAIENSIANANGSIAGKGNVGIWMWQSNNVVVQRNSAYGNRSPLGGDGGGFDIDGGVTNSIVQYNMSQDNSGAGYLLAEFRFAEPMMQNVFRYNLSVNDGTDGYGAFTIWGEDSTSIASSTLFHNNTAVVDQAAAPGSRGTVWFINENHNDISFINNVFVALNDAALIDGSTSVDKARFVNNAYWTGGAPVRIGGTVFDSIEAWADGSQQETFSGQFTGIEADPNFDNGGNYRPVPPSQVVDAGLPPGASAWPDWFTGVGPSDLYGISLPPAAGVDLGAAEYPRLPGDYNSNDVVDAADYSTWRDTLGATGAALAADGNRNGAVDVGDYQFWKSHFGQTANSAGRSSELSNSFAVPEPATLIIVAMTFVAASWMRFSRLVCP